MLCWSCSGYLMPSRDYVCSYLPVYVSCSVCVAIYLSINLSIYLSMQQSHTITWCDCLPLPHYAQRPLLYLRTCKGTFVRQRYIHRYIPIVMLMRSTCFINNLCTLQCIYLCVCVYVSSFEFNVRLVALARRGWKRSSGTRWCLGGPNGKEGGRRITWGIQYV